MSNRYSIIIDCNYICYRALHTTGMLSFQGTNTGITYGFMYTLLQLAKKFNPIEFVFAWDSKENLRKRVRPEYKLKDKTEYEWEQLHIAYNEFDSIRQMILPFIGYKNIHCLFGYESDDIIASVVKRYKKKNWLIVSADKDLYQLLSQADMYNTKKVYTYQDFIYDYDTVPRKWSMVKAIAGCDGDNVKGIPGVGEKTAIKYLNDELGKHTKAYSKIANNLDLINDNFDLVDLPYNGLIVDLNEEEEVLSYDNFVELCIVHGFKDFKMEEFKEFLNLY